MRVNRDRILYVFRIFLIAMMLGTVVFIFVNSCLPPEVSSEESEAVGGFITSLIPEDTELYKFVKEYIRKIAHFTEYGMLGIEIAVYIMLYEKRRLPRARGSESRGKDPSYRCDRSRTRGIRTIDHGI